MTSNLPPAVTELSDPYANFMLSPLPGPRSCRVCFTFCGEGYSLCPACARAPQRWLAAVAPISFSVAGGQLHHALRSYKGRGPTGGANAVRQFEYQLAAVLWRFLDCHEACVARAVGVTDFPIVTAVPSGNLDRARTHPLRRIVSRYLPSTRDRFVDIVQRTSTPVADHAYDARRYRVSRPLNGEPVLLIDDTWTTGASAQTAAAALIAAGSGRTGCVVIGRHIHDDFADNDVLLAGLPSVFDWSTCSLHRQ